MNFNDVAIVSVKGSDYRIHFWYMSKDDVINIMKNFHLNEKSGLLCIFFSLCIKMCQKNNYQRNRETILNRARDYYENNKEVLRDKANNKYRELSEEKNIKREYGRNTCQNMSEENKTKIKKITKKLSQG